MKKLFSVAVLAVSMFAVVASSATTYAQSFTLSMDNPNDITNTGPAIPADNPDYTLAQPPIIIVPPDPSAYARLFVNESKIAYVEYGGSATLKWESKKMSSCTVTPTNQTGTSGQYVMQNITSNAQVKIDCLTVSGIPYSAAGQSRNANVSIKVLPPTFDYLREYLSSLQPDNGRSVNLTTTSVMVEQAQKAYNSGNTDRAQSFLQRSIDSLKQHATRGNFTTDAINQYENAANYLSKTLPVKLAVAPDGCSITATGFAGLTLDYGSHRDGIIGDIYALIGVGPQYPIILGWSGMQTPLSTNETTTRSISARSGWTTFGKIVGTDGTIYATDTVAVATDCYSGF